MNSSYATEVTRHLAASHEALGDALRDPGFVDAVVRAAGSVADALRAGNKVLIAGNGGSAADAQHLASELMVRFYLDRAPLPAIALGTDASSATAIGNDLGFEQLFSRQVLAIGHDGDMFIALSASGRLRISSQPARPPARARGESSASPDQDAVQWTIFAKSSTGLHGCRACSMRDRRTGADERLGD